eukprot:CAMPEP_0170550450 /NCGR_PEP_ID=MMETSP0211-20121228/8515_1 /TAXON_ID=311385 /ORGANISM="Pseudokeronopsis sp., Strain OXSARD2" /LENGTH=59 /DNA_ID=CAMNT_0010857009 /DNA_START=816 /DNA_END=995 /DNA_ORIENTATION=-
MKNPSANSSVSQIISIAHFDPEALPYVFIRDHMNVIFYDIKSKKGYWLLKGIESVGDLF